MERSSRKRLCSAKERENTSVSSGGALLDNVGSSSPLGPRNE
jgi:hypothetical protein